MEKYPSAKNVCPPNQSTNIYYVPILRKDGPEPAVFSKCIIFHLRAGNSESRTAQASGPQYTFISHCNCLLTNFQFSKARCLGGYVNLAVG